MDKKAKHGTGTEAYLGGRSAKPDADWFYNRNKQEPKTASMNHPYLDIVLLKNPVNGAMEQMPIAMVNAYVPFASFLHLEDAAKVAAIRDQEESDNLFISIHTEYQTEEGTGYDRLSVPIV